MQTLLHRAATALGWDGVVVPDVAVLGQQVSAVVRLLPEVHEWRTQNGWPPRADPSWFRSWFEPEAHDRLPVAAVELVGVLVSESTTDRALQSCGTLLTLAPCAVMLPLTDESQAWSYIELDYYGIGVVVADDSTVDLMVPPEDRSPEFGPSLFGRWLLEVLYERVLKASHAPASTSSQP